MKLLSEPGLLVRCDYAGIVKQVGRRVQKGFAPVDRIFGVVHACNARAAEDGAFAQYVVAKGDIQWKIPGNLSFQEATTLVLGLLTSVQTPLANPPVSMTEN